MGIFKRTIKRKNGKSEYWYIDYVINGKRKWESVGRVGEVTKSDAKKLLALRNTEILQDKFGVPVKKSIPYFSEYSKEYLNYAKGNKKSWDRDACALRCLVPFFGKNLITDISPLMIERYKLERKITVSLRTINIEISLLRRMYNLAISWGLCESNPVSKVKFYKEEPTEERILSREEERDLLASSPEHIRPILMTALNTGMRYGEIMSLTWQDCFRQGHLAV